SSTWGMASCRRRRSRMCDDWWSLCMSIRRAATPMQTEISAPSESSAHVVIAGGGIAGLSAAWYLQQEAARQSIPVRSTLLEASERWGGEIRSERIEGAWRGARRVQ